MASKKDYIQESAYFIWMNRGCPDSQDLAIWEEAARLYELTHTTKPVKKVVQVKKVAKKVAKKVTVKATVAKIAVKKEVKKVVAEVKKEVRKVAPKIKVVAKKIIAKKPVAKKVAVKKAPVKIEAKKIETAKIIPMVKKEDMKKVAPKTKIKIVVGAKK